MLPFLCQSIWDRASEERSPTEWALQWVWNQPEVSVALNGMSTMQHVTENVASASHSGPDILDQETLALYDQVHTKYQALCPISCTKCEYCLHYTVGLNIPRLFDGLNRGVMYQRMEDTRHRYERLPKISALPPASSAGSARVNALSPFPSASGWCMSTRCWAKAGIMMLVLRQMLEVTVIECAI